MERVVVPVAVTAVHVCVAGVGHRWRSHDADKLCLQLLQGMRRPCPSLQQHKPGLLLMHTAMFDRVGSINSHAKFLASSNILQLPVQTRVLLHFWAQGEDLLLVNVTKSLLCPVEWSVHCFVANPL
jgi:hypothetical protein